jgi:hypothetical protein
VTLASFVSTPTIDGWLDLYGFLVVFLLVMIESMGVPMPGETSPRPSTRPRRASSRLVIIGVVVWSKRKEGELHERAAREIPGSVAEELGEDESAT